MSVYKAAEKLDDTMKNQNLAIGSQTTRREFLGGMALALGGAGACFLPTLS